MGKRGRNKDRLYIKTSEYSDGMGGMKEKQGEGPRYVLLPFTYCCLTFLPMEDPVFTQDGRCYEKEALVKYLQKNKKNPATGEPMGLDDVYKMKITKSDKNETICPVTSKVLTEHSRVVAIRTTGRVYSHDAVNEMNVKAKNWCDLVEGTPFKKSDIITIQDPSKMIEDRNTATFHHVTSTTDSKKKTKKTVKKASKDTDDSTPTEDSTPAFVDGIFTKPLTSHPDGVKFASAGLTCSAAVPYSKDEKKSSKKDIDNEIFNCVKEAGAETLARIQTTVGDIDVKLHSSLVPRTCYNFVKLAEQGYYSNVTFHRVIKDFMAQTGDPTATGCGGSSYWGKPFPDEFHPTLKHNRKGTLSMANSGPDSNGSQFFITTAPGAVAHLDRKHSVFGQVMGSLAVLDRINTAPTDADDKSDIKILSVDVYRNPFTSAEARVHDSHDGSKQAALRELESKERKAASEVRPWFSAPQPTLANSESNEVGKYMDSKEAPAPQQEPAEASFMPPKKKAKKWDFSGW
eukprot:TRINITY_DN34507_c0_g1_i1.p1 TRINITY_DN34507_c0_g1~~TRINITY_DN34507_c0_g1_i1.p1  ORF type:complete len:537 (+),score=122.18 TRINITY_DN34507_c0_g1_i1:67-1611(+)